LPQTNLGEDIRAAFCTLLLCRCHLGRDRLDMFRWFPCLPTCFTGNGQTTRGRSTGELVRTVSGSMLRSLSGSLYKSAEDHQKKKKEARLAKLDEQRLEKQKPKRPRSFQPPRAPPPVNQTEMTFPSPPPAKDRVASPVENVGDLCCQKVQGDNSCLFHAILTAVGDCRRVPSELRFGAIQDYLSFVPQDYFAAESDQRSREEYKRWIRQPESWGGSLELYILSNYYGVQICVVHVPGGGMIPFPAKPLPGNKRIYVLYNGKHYDCVMPVEAVVEHPERGPGCAGVFKASDKETERKVLDLAPQLGAIMQKFDVNYDTP